MVFTWWAWHRLTAIIAGSQMMRNARRQGRRLLQGLPLCMLTRSAGYGHRLRDCPRQIQGDRAITGWGHSTAGYLCRILLL